MAKINVNLGLCSYDIIIGENVISSLSNRLEKLHLSKYQPVVVTNEVIYKLYGNFLKKQFKSHSQLSFIKVPDSEKAKSWQVLFNVLKTIVSFDKGKNIFLVALGGGVVGDLTGFVAAIYKRGIPYIQLPTTLLAQVDSGIGGKVAVDLSWGKNLIGAFYQPKIVISEIGFLNTLPTREIRNGFSEIIKCGIIDGELFSLLEANRSSILDVSSPKMLKIIKKCAQLKAAIVEKDEFDSKDIRIALNLGHTIGHAMESAFKYAMITHGEGIALGLIAESIISNKIGILSRKNLDRIISLIVDLKCLPIVRKTIKIADIVSYLPYDKKNKFGQSRLVVPSKIGGVKIVTGLDEKIIESSIKDALEYL
ncbi:MAG: 3-dehydroquinate synthase [Candidatus Saelkia tenebricola]|nr:3-dehydroquinate synthase [Candidatus Saelkia tenebricola]